MEGPIDPTPPETEDLPHAAVIRAQRAVWGNLARGFRRPWMTVSILGVISMTHLLAGVIQLVKGQANLAGVLVASRPTSILVYLGAMYNPRVSDGEVWRLVSCLFLHGDGMHILLNPLNPTVKEGEPEFDEFDPE